MKSTCIKVLVYTAAMLTIGCATQQYWVKQQISIQQTSADLSECRIQANQGGQKVFSAMELEFPCMVAKGYQLSNKPASQ